MKVRALALPIALVFLAAGSAEAKFCSTDEVPAATLLLPYFEVDLEDTHGLTTLFSINNAFDTAALAHVTLWTDWGIPTIEFDIYLTGYDVQTINLRDVFHGVLPLTASDGQDPTDSISPQGFLSQDVNFSSCSAIFPYPVPISTVIQSELRLAHQGGNARQIFGGCVGESFNDGRVRGYVTIDAVRRCSLDYPTAPGYFDDTATRENRLWGFVTYVDGNNNFAQQESLVHIEACDPAQPDCPTGPGSYTFYGRYVGFDGSDDREPLGTVFAASFQQGSAFSAGTNLLVWRDTKRPATGANGATSCAPLARPSWFPLGERDVVSFDEQENPHDECFVAAQVLPPPGAIDVCFPLATQRTPIGYSVGGSLDPVPIIPSMPFGWIYLDLNHTLATADPMPGRAQAWVTAVSSASGRYSTAADAVRLDSACNLPSRPILID